MTRGKVCGEFVCIFPRVQVQIPISHPIKTKADPRDRLSFLLSEMDKSRTLQIPYGFAMTRGKVCDREVCILLRGEEKVLRPSRLSTFSIFPQSTNCTAQKPA